MKEFRIGVLDLTPEQWGRICMLMAVYEEAVEKGETTKDFWLWMNEE